MVSRLASHYPERFAAYAFLVVAFWPVLPPEDIQVSLENWKKLYGSELFGYWRFHSEPDSAELIQSHVCVRARSFRTTLRLGRAADRLVLQPLVPARSRDLGDSHGADRGGEAEPA